MFKGVFIVDFEWRRSDVFIVNFEYISHVVAGWE